MTTCFFLRRLLSQEKAVICHVEHILPEWFKFPIPGCLLPKGHFRRAQALPFDKLHPNPASTVQMCRIKADPFLIDSAQGNHLEPFSGLPASARLHVLLAPYGRDLPCRSQRRRRAAPWHLHLCHIVCASPGESSQLVNLPSSIPEGSFLCLHEPYL